MPVLKTPKVIVTGEDALREAMPYAAACGKKALIVTGPHVVRTGMMKEVTSSLEKAGISYEIFAGISGEPDDGMIGEGLRKFQEAGCDFCVGFGGGSPLDAAKAISAMSVLKGKIADYSGLDIRGAIPPIIAIPTTAGTGSEATKFTVITDRETNVKMLLRGDGLLPSVAAVNPIFTEGMPKSVTAATGLDALTHAVEAYTSKKAMLLTDTLALSAVRRIMDYLPAAYQDGSDRKAREEISLAALEAGICINNSSVTIVHGMSRPIGALFHVPHGLSNAMLLHECLSFAVPGAEERFAELGKDIGAEEGSAGSMAQEFLCRIAEVVRICEVPSLGEYGVGRKEYERSIEKMSKDAVASGSPGNTRREVTEKDCMEIYRRVYGQAE